MTRWPIRLSVLFAVVAVLLVATLAAPAAAAAQFSFRGGGAFASWALGDDQNTHVFLDVFDGTFHSPPGPPEDRQAVFFDMFQEFCDEESDEFVFLEYFFFGRGGRVEVVVDRLRGAAVDGTIRAQGFEFRAPDCENPDFDNGESRELEPVSVHLSATWTGRGDVERTREVFRFQQNDCKFSFRSGSKHRDARTTATISSPSDVLDLGTLGRPDHSELFSTHGKEMVIGKDCLVGER